MKRGFGYDLRIAIVIPALNEETSVGEVVHRVSKVCPVIVVDDGSGDETANVARAAGAEVVRHQSNLGYDAALESGMQRALVLGYDAAITMDADGQHDVEALRDFLADLQGGADMVIGIRDHKQRIAETVFSWVSSVLWDIRDPLCGMKGYRLDLLRRARRFDTYRSIGTELMVRAAKSKCSIRQVPLKTIDRPGVSRFGGGLRPNYRILRGLFFGLFRASALK
jgi:glycosyltransferase involved in cell wall biosynthesis